MRLRAARLRQSRRIAMTARIALVAPVLAALAVSAGCSSNPGTAGLPEQHESDPVSEPTGTTSEPLSTVTRSTVIANAMQWVNAMLLYCQSPNGQPDGDTSCSSTCMRQSNPQWDPY